MGTITLSGNYGYQSYHPSSLPSGTVIDAETATWIVDNSTSDGTPMNAYPVNIKGAPSVTIDGGEIWGNVNQTAEWRTVYANNSAAVRTEDCFNVVIRDWRIDKAWDAINVSWRCPNFLVEDIWATNIRDDAMENDRLLSGTIRDSLFDGVFAGISVDPSSSSPVDGHNETMILDGVLMRMKEYLYEGEMTHESFIKTDSATSGAVTPHLQYFNCVIAIEDVTHHSYRSLADAWKYQTAASGNYYLNLSDTPLPSNYPMPPAGWTVLQGQAARDYWNNARDTWIANHDGSDPPPPLPVDKLPDAVNDSASTAFDTAVTVSVLANDNQGDAPATISAFGQGVNGSVVNNGNGTLTYTPATGFTGNDSFNYTIRDVDGDVDSAGIAVAVGSGPPPPPPPPPGDHVFEKRVVAGSDDAEQRGSSLDLSSSDLELVADGSTVQKVGLRFTGIDIPKGAVITNAWIQFQTDETSSTATSLQIRGQDSDDAFTFANTSNNISSRAVTDAFATWNPAAWNTVGEHGLNQRTSDLSDVVEEIVGRDGWASGNDIAMIITGQGTRTAEAFESGAATATLLHIDWTFPL
jgi:hypothetical protein